MSALRYAAIRGAFEALWLSRLPYLVRRLSRSRGVIFTLHRVLPDRPADFSPNAILQVRPEFLDFTIRRMRRLGLDIVDLDEAVRRIESNEIEKKFVAFTFDDAYRDNLIHALPVLRRHKCPFALYVPTAFVDGVGEVWWQALEDIIAAERAIALIDNDETEYFAAETLTQKRRAYDELYWRLRTMPEAQRVATIRGLARSYGYDLGQQCRELIMNWDELKLFAADPLCTIGAHTVRHYELAKLPVEEARNEIEQSVGVLRSQLGFAPRHLSYPIGGPSSAGPREFGLARALGLRSGVTTVPGGIYAAHRERLHALPRISLNGLFQAHRYVDVLATGALFPVRK